MQKAKIAKLPVGAVIAVSGTGRRCQLGDYGVDRAVLLANTPTDRKEFRYSTRPARPFYPAAVARLQHHRDEDGNSTGTFTRWEPRWLTAAQILGHWGDHEEARASLDRQRELSRERERRARGTYETWKADTIDQLRAAGFTVDDYGFGPGITVGGGYDSTPKVEFSDAALTRVLAALNTNETAMEAVQ